MHSIMRLEQVVHRLVSCPPLGLYLLLSFFLSLNLVLQDGSLYYSLMVYCVSILSSEWDCVIFQSKDWVLKFFCNNYHGTQLKEFSMEEALSKPLKDWNVSSFFQTYCLTNSFLFHMKILKGLLYYIISVEGAGEFLISKCLVFPAA